MPSHRSRWFFSRCGIEGKAQRRSNMDGKQKDDAPKKTRARKSSRPQVSDQDIVDLFVKKNNWGGARPGAGRKRSNRPTVAKKVPMDLLGRVNAMIRITEPLFNKKDENGKPVELWMPHPNPQKLRLPTPVASVPAGFPSYAEDYVDDYIDLNELLIGDPESTFLVRAGGNSMFDAGIEMGDLLIIDRDLMRNPNEGDVVLADLGNAYTIKRLAKTRDGEIYLKSENASGDYPDFHASQGDTWTIIGVVTSVIKRFRAL